MHLTRRTLLAASAAVAAGALLPRRAIAQTTLTLGGTRLDTLSDGNLQLPLDFALGDVPMDEAAPILAAHGITEGPLTPPCNVTLLRDGTHTVLFDVGAGPDFMSTTGRLPAALDAAGVAPEDVTHVVFTHAHPDHLWGILDDFDDPMFPQARHLMGADELDYWRDPATVDTIGQMRQTFAVGAARRIEALGDLLEPFADGDEILPGVAARLTPGHTPGHMAFEIAGGALILGDAVVNHHLAFARPGWRAGSDQDPDRAAETRLRLFDRVTADALVLVGFHLPEGGIGRAERAEDGFRFVPGV